MEHAKLPLEMPETKKDEGPVTCLGMTFENDQERREYFTEILRQKLPELKKIEGYPIGEDEDILALSDPPYYTACPNPFINDFVDESEREKKEFYGGNVDEYRREPFAADVSEGKGDPVYNAHSYHTKVPHRAIMRYILHYTNPHDLVFDGFAGTGMTAIAAELCGDANVVSMLGYTVENDGIVKAPNGDLTSQIGERRCIVNDLSPIASFIAYNYNMSVNLQEFKKEALKIIGDVEKEYSWLLEVEHSNKGNKKKGKINYVIWSEVFSCPQCTNEIIFWDAAVDLEKCSLKDSFQCPACESEVRKADLDKIWETSHDTALNKLVKHPKQVPVLINYSVGKERHEREPSASDMEIIDRVENTAIKYRYPVTELPRGVKTKEPVVSHGYTHLHHFYTKRNLLILSALYDRVQEVRNARIRAMILMLLSSYNLTHSTKLSRVIFKKNQRKPVLTGYQTGTLYVSSLPVEKNICSALRSKIRVFLKAFDRIGSNTVVSTQSITSIGLNDNSVDYIFTDPPFGRNIMYSELNFFWESWINVLTNNHSEAIINTVQAKGLPEYSNLMNSAFHEYYRILKPGRWMTVEFSNSQASVWNVIQEAIQRSGFVIANVSVLDKKQGSFNAVTTTTAVKQDLVISAYKPSRTMIVNMRKKRNTEESAWIFVRNHLENLPVFVGKKGAAGLVVERTPRILFDRMVAYHVQNGYSVPISSAEFQEGVAQRFPMRDGMAFLETQVTEYDKKRLLAKEFVQTALFVSDENSAIEWLRQQLMQKPQTRQDLHPNFMKELQHISKHELLPELDVLLEQNFLMYEGTGLVPSQIHSYLSTDFKDLRNLEKDDPKLQAKAKNRWYVPDPNKQADLEKLRERSLLREFNGYIEELGKSKKKLRQFRTEAIRAGFKTAWGNQDYQTIVDVGQRLPEKVLQEDSTMLMYYDNAQIRLGM